VAPHNPTGPVVNAMTLQLAATIPNFCILETIAVDVPWRREIVRESLEFSNSEIRIPACPAGAGAGRGGLPAAPLCPPSDPQFDRNRGSNRPEGALALRESKPA